MICNSEVRLKNSGYSTFFVLEILKFLGYSIFYLVLCIPYFTRKKRKPKIKKTPKEISEFVCELL